MKFETSSLPLLLITQQNLQAFATCFLDNLPETGHPLLTAAVTWCFYRYYANPSSAVSVEI